MTRTEAAIRLAAAGILLVPAGVAALFDEPQVISAGGGPTVVVAGDFDGDGTVDLAVTAPAVGRVSLHAGRGDGTFRFPRGLDVGGHPTILAAGDIDRNGRLDVVWADEASGDIGVIYQLATNPASYRLESRGGADEPQDLLLADVDGDLWPDVLTANHGADVVSVYPNVGGTLGPPVLYDVGDGPAGLVDVSTPGLRRISVVQVGALSSNVGLYDSGFEPVQLLSIDEPAAMAPVDWNGDAFPDLLVTDAAGQGVVYVGDAGGQLSSQASWTLAPGASTVAPMRTMGGEPGAVTLEATRNRVVLSARTGPGQVENLAGYFVGQKAGRFAWANVDADPAEELVVPIPEEEILLLMHREGDALRGLPSVLSGRFPQQIEVVEAAGGLPARAAVLCPPSHDLWLYEIVGGRLVPMTTLPAPPLARRFRWANLDGDGLPDLVLLDAEDGFWIYRGQPNGFAPVEVVSVPGDYRDIVVVPWGPGTEPDILLTDAQLRGARIFSPQPGGFAESGFFTCQHVPAVATVIDLDLDGLEDLVTLGNGSTICLSYNGPGGLDQQTVFTVGNEPRGITFGYFNTDALPDLAVGNAGDATFTVIVSLLPRIYGLGAQNQVAPSGSQTAATIDFNADGRDDLVFTSVASNSITLHAGIGNGSFTVPTRVRCSSLPSDLAAFEVDGDGQLDLLVLDTLGDAVVSLLTSGGAAAPPSEPASTQLVPGSTGLYLAPPYPNPSEGIVHLRLRAEGELAPSARVYDLRGRRVADLRLSAEADGWYAARWDGRDGRGRSVARGRYLVEIRAGERRTARAVTLD